jgi:hypothetical protein
MKWKKVLRITAMTLIPGGLVGLGAWAVVKALRSKKSGNPKVRVPKDEREAR